MASRTSTRRAVSMSGSSLMPQVPPSTSSTSGGSSQPARKRASMARPKPSSPMIGFPKPRTSVPPEARSLIDVSVVGGDEAATGDDRGDRATVLEHVRPDGEVDVNRNEDQEGPGRHVVNEADVLHPAQRRPQPAEKVEEDPARIRLTVQGEARDDGDQSDQVHPGVAQLLQRIMPDVSRGALRMDQQIELDLLEE